MTNISCMKCKYNDYGSHEEPCVLCTIEDCKWEELYTPTCWELYGGINERN